MTIGENAKRVGALDRVGGRTLYGADQGREGDLFLVCARAEKAPAKLEGIDVSAAEQVPGVVRIFTAADIPGINRLGIIPVTKDQEFLAGGYIRHYGQAAALVAAETLEAARAGARAVKLKLTSLKGVFSVGEALARGANLVHPETRSDNLLASRSIIKGDADAALARSAVVHEAEYTTTFIEHAAIETEGGRAFIQDGRLVITACSQNPHYDRDDVARFLGLEPDLVRVIQAETGGGFGGKLDVSVQPYLGLAAWLLKRPVRMVYTREETFLGTGKRHPFRMHYITGADENGRLTAMKIDMSADSGAFASYGLAVASRAAVHATGPYFVPDLKIDCRLAYTNNPWAGAMRGFGVPQVALAHEGQMDALADKLGLDRLEIRLLNALRPGQATATGQVLTSGVGIVRCLEELKPVYEKYLAESKNVEKSPAESKNVEKSRAESENVEKWLSEIGNGLGVGLGAMFYGIGNTGMSNPSTAQIAWTPDGEIILYTGAAELGQGSDTVLRQMAAARLNVDPERIRLIRGDTDLTTNAGATSASRQTYISGNAVLEAAGDLENLILSEAENMLEIHRRDLELSGGIIAVKGSPSSNISVTDVAGRLADKGVELKGRGSFDPETVALDPVTGQGSPYETYAFAAQVALAEVDRASGEITVKKVTAAHDVGRAINRREVEGQICGGVMMGLGMALMEEFVPGKSENFEDYHIPTIMDMPEIEPIIVQEPAETGPFGAKGVGEPALIPTAPAIASAVSQALGRPMRDLPIGLERVMEVLTEEKNED